MTLSQAKIAAYYEQHWKTISGLQMSSQLAQLGYSLCSQLPKGHCLDIGCGDGSNSIILKKLGFTVEGCDIAFTALRKAGQKGIKTRQVDLNKSKLPYSTNQFKLVWMTDVIEHVIRPDSAMAEVYRILQPGGYLFLTTPNVSWWGIKAQLLIGKTLADVHPEHIYWFTSKSLKNIVSQSGLSLKLEYGYQRLFPYPLTDRLPFLGKLDHVSNKTNPVFTYTIAILAQK